MWWGAVPHPRVRALVEPPCGRSQQERMIMTRSFEAMLVVVLAALALPAGASAPSPISSAAANSNSVEPAAIETHSGEAVVFWNLTAFSTIEATPLGPRAAPLASRAMAMMHVAM